MVVGRHQAYPMDCHMASILVFDHLVGIQAFLLVFLRVEVALVADLLDDLLGEALDGLLGDLLDEALDGLLYDLLDEDLL